MSRGIPMDEARRLVVRGFFTEIISYIEEEAIQERLMARIDGELERVGQ
jgi:Fe-S cluster assembly protein SufD